jgi:hypothetical protein
VGRRQEIRKEGGIDRAENSGKDKEEHGTEQGRVGHFKKGQR